MVATAIAGTDAFGEQVAGHRRELLVHCYRMLGSIDDAEDAVQETFVRAWNRRETFRVEISLRAWLYRIATNVCLDAIERRHRAPGASGGSRLEVHPVPLDLVDEATPGPEARYDALESVSLAFLTALQRLSPRQRAVLILRDVLSWHATEVAELLETSVPATNSALHRARQTVGQRYHQVRGPEPKTLRSLLDRYVRAWESADIPGLVALLREDAVVSMPPGLAIAGSTAIGEFLASSVFGGGRRVRLVPIAVNGGPAFVIQSGGPTDRTLEPYAVLVLDVDRGDDRGLPELEAPAVARMTVFADPRLVARFASLGRPT